jgi:hypothetical protein
MEKVVTKRALKEKSSAIRYWLSRTVDERIGAIEMLRQQYFKFKYNDVQPRLQRVCRIIKQKDQE